MRSLVAIVAGVLVAAVGVVWWVLRASLPTVTGTLHVPIVSAPVTIIRDHAGVPHVFAASAPDAMRRGAASP